MPRYEDTADFDGIEIFFDALKEKCSTESEYAAELLKARGFLLEDTGLALSDNSHRDDASYLNRILQIEQLGEVIDGKIFIRPDANVEKIFYKDKWIGGEVFVALAEKNFYKNNWIGGEAFYNGKDWKIFVHNSFAPKVGVFLLEPFIARYVKAISACGVGTCSSCDGNHNLGRFPIRGSHWLLVESMDKPNALWHKIICKRLLDGRFNLNWNSEYSKIRLTKANKWQTYIKINRAGEFLYNNRIKIRQIRREAARGISNKMSRTLPDDELAEIFSERANKLFDDFCKEL